MCNCVNRTAMSGLFTFLIWSLLFLSSGPSLVLALDGLFGKEGVCKNDTIVTKSKPLQTYVTHTEVRNKKCGILRQNNCPETVTKGEWVTQPDVTWQETVTTEHCCQGYSMESGRCVPECGSGCVNGVCRSPNHCICIGGYLKKEGSEECEPQCSTPCGENQFCSRPNECSCNAGFELSIEDRTKCRPSRKLCAVLCDHGYCPDPTVCVCLEGYFFHVYDQVKDSRCDPICPKDCVNATCTAPNQCTCLEGYKSVEENVCAPNICDKPCINGYCSEEKKCECKEGYKHSDSDPYLCEPVCSKPCKNGICINPEECTCLTNYAISKEDHYICKPVCKNGCVNGECTLPDVCTCKDGYRKEKEEVCEPVCDEVCVNGFCSAPNTCSCLEGYENDPLKPSSCRPICSKPCLNATCTAPETCSCYSGYEKVPNDDFRCLPVCHEKCVNAECSDPEVCSCLKGYEKDIERPNVCIPLCSKECKNGHCAAPETCSCDSGFKINDKDASVCDPECSQECVNGFCSSPGVCSCKEGYKVDDSDNNKCYPVCTQECLHGTCSAPDKCSCNIGYDETDNAFVCSPHCAKACINGNCTSPNFCECFPNHEKDEKDPHICQATCAEECTNGYCEAKDVCKCKEGFSASDIPNVCNPMCTSCTNGICESPEVCRCEDGYENLPGRRDICMPICEKECLNGECVEPNVCGCFKGYKMKDNSCQPHCSGCENGECRAPNQCECYAGYKINKESRECEAVCNVECLNGACSTPDECSCLWGFDTSDEEDTCVRSSLKDPFTCYFPENFLSRKKSEICFTQETELKLTDLDECLFLTSIVLKYLQNSSNYEVSFDCILNYFNDDEGDPTLLLDCSTKKVINVDDQGDLNHEGNYVEEEKESVGHLTGRKWMDGGSDDDNDDKEEGNADYDRYFEDFPEQSGEENDTFDEESGHKGKELPPAKGAPIIYLPPLLPTIITQAANRVESVTQETTKEKEGRTIQDLLQTPSPIINDLEKMKPVEKKVGFIPAVKNALIEIRRDMKTLKKEVAEIEKREKEEKKAKKIAKTKAKIQESEEEENESESDESGEKQSDVSDTSKKEFILNVHNVQKNMTHFPAVIKINNLPFIIKQKITDSFFEEIPDIELLSEWCLCLNSTTTNTMCLDGKYFTMTLCPCTPVPTVPAVLEALAMKFLYWAIAFVLAVLQVFIVIYLVSFCRKRRRRRKVVATRELQRKNVNTNSTVNSLQVRVNLENEIEPNPLDEVESSSKL